MSNSTALVQKLWNYCNILRDDGLSYGDYVEQLTFLLFLKMADEQSRAQTQRTSHSRHRPSGTRWSAFGRYLLRTQQCASVCGGAKSVDSLSGRLLMQVGNDQQHRLPPNRKP